MYKSLAIALLSTSALLGILAQATCAFAAQSAVVTLDEITIVGSLPIVEIIDLPLMIVRSNGGAQ
jgi:hypothetical protein